MKIKELNVLRRKMFDEIIKVDDIVNALKLYNQVYVYEISLGYRHEVITVGLETQLRGYLADNNYDANKTFIKLLYTVNKQTKQCY